MQPAPMSPRPPRFIARLAERWLLPEYESLYGDLREDHLDDVRRFGRAPAGLVYASRLLYLVLYLRLRHARRSNIMLRVNLLVALRNLRKSLGYSAINIIGLAVSMSVGLLVITLLREQLSYDRFHANADRIWRITSEVEEPFGRFPMATSAGPLGPALLEDVPSVERATRLRRMGGSASYGDVTVEERGLRVESSFFDLFDFPMVRGNPATALSAPYSVVLTRSSAERYFGGADPVGKVLQRGDLGGFTVTGVLEDPPTNTHLAFEALASFSTLVALSGTDDPYSIEDWTVSSALYTYLLLAPGARTEDIVARAQSLVDAHEWNSERPRPTIGMQALTDINLGGDLSNQLGPVMPKDASYFLLFFGAILLIIAVFNYVNLTIARAIRRAREIGIRKVMGAARAQIVAQFALEAVVVALLALVVAAAMLVWLLPAFNNLSGFRDALDLGSITVDPFRDGLIYLLFIGFAVAVGMVAGLVPAFRMSSIAPSPVLRGLAGAAGRREGLGRRGLIVFQFAVAIVGVVTALLVHRQMSMVLQADYGFGEDRLLSVDLQDAPFGAVAHEFSSLAGVEGVAATSTMPSGESKVWTSIRGENGEDDLLLQFFSVDAEFPRQLHLEVVEGRGLDGVVPGSDPEPVWLTVAATRALGYEQPGDAVGAALTVSPTWEAHPGTVVGVLADFYARGYERGYTPAMLRVNPEGYQRAVVRLAPGDVQTTVGALEDAFEKVAPTAPFVYRFYDEEIASQYTFVRDLVRFLGLLAAFVILIACLGLLGAASHSAQRRFREVGIRKVLGADVRGTVALLSRDYVRMIAVAVLVAGPLSYLAGRALLEKFPNHVEFDAWLFAMGILPIVALALVTVGTQTVRAALTNPVETLRQE